VSLHRLSCKCGVSANSSISQLVVPQVAQSSIMISPLKLVIRSNLRLIKPSSTLNVVIMDDSRETAEKTLRYIKCFVSIQPTVIDDHDILSDTHCAYTVLNAVDPYSGTFQTQTSIHASPIPMEVIVSSSTES
jgi:hypothetical protein